jgi:light-regulated signal transduction histidine kinase (bacteriophytochrome)
VVRDAVSALQAELGDRPVEWHIGPLPTVSCDPGLVRVVFTNLLSNAVKYSRLTDAAVIEVGHLPSPGGAPVVFVRDNGVGFDMKHADKLFGVFQRLHGADQFEGTGVGLATVRRIVHKHGGEIWAEGRPGEGATFFFTLAPPRPAELGDTP